MAESSTGMHAATGAQLIRSSGPLLTRFLDGLGPDQGTVQAPSLPNHPVWTLGHCAMTMHKLAAAMDGHDFPDCDFLHGDGKGGDTHRYDTKSVCFGSVPMIDPSRYPNLARGRIIFDRAVERLANTIEQSADLDAPVDWHGIPIPAGGLVMRVAFHNGCHAGQLTDLRRAIGLSPVIG